MSDLRRNWAIAFGLALFFFQRRDITVGAWPWQRGKIPADAVSVPEAS